MSRNRMTAAIRLTFRHSGVLLAVLFLAVTISAGLRSPYAPPRAQAQAQFADPAFRTTWERTDGPVESGSVQRGWVWGPTPGKAMTEPFVGLPGNVHLVQYFDKGRMEINDPNGNKSDPFYVTSGLLSGEMISGYVTEGFTKTTYLGPAFINLASDLDDRTAPTYQSFNGVSNIPGAFEDRRAAPATGQPVTTAIDRQGVTRPWPPDHPTYGVQNVFYSEITGHNIPNVFWNYLNSQGPIIQDGQVVNGPLFSPIFYVTGYPISEAYWSYVKVSGRYTDVLIQAYERRVLTFIPANTEGWQVQLGNDGQHYYNWRYGGTIPQATVVPLPPLANVSITGISYPQSIVDINGSFVVIQNNEDLPVRLNGWRIDAPHWDFIDSYSFPNGIVIAPGASLNVRSGIGESTSTDLYMFRATPMWVVDPANLAILYDQYGRTVSRFFPSGAQPPTPTLPPATATPPGLPPTVTPGGIPPTVTLAATPPGGATVTPTKEVPTPVPTNSPSALP